MGSPDFPLKHVILEALFQLKEEKAIELQFTVGEAIACTAGGTYCSAAQDPWKFRESKHEELRYMHTWLRCTSLRLANQVLLIFSLTVYSIHV